MVIFLSPRTSTQPEVFASSWKKPQTPRRIVWWASTIDSSFTNFTTRICWMMFDWRLTTTAPLLCGQTVVTLLDSRIVLFPLLLYLRPNPSCTRGAPVHPATSPPHPGRIVLRSDQLNPHLGPGELVIGWWPKLDDGWPESVEEQGLLLLVWRHHVTKQYIKDVL